MRPLTPAREAQYASRRLQIPAETLAAIHARLIAGEEWVPLAKEFECSAYGLKACLLRAGFNCDIKSLRATAHRKTRDIRPRAVKDVRNLDMKPTSSGSALRWRV
jgi:hypothetical protein